MSVTTRALAAAALLLGAAIPVGALTVNNTSDKDFTIGVANGRVQAVYTVPAGGSVDVKEDCSSDCAVTGPWGFSHLVPQNAVITSDGFAIVPTDVAAKETAPAPGLVPQDPAAEPVEVAVAAPAEPPAADPAPVVKKTPKRAAKPNRPRRPAKQAKKGPRVGSFQMLFQGPGR